MSSTPELQALYRPIHLPWIARLSRLQRVLVALVVGVVIFGGGGILDFLVRYRYIPAASLILGGAGVAFALALSVFRVLTDLHERSEAMLDRLRLIAELNHHIRNALQVIAFHNVPERNAHAIEQVRSAVARIESVLREVLPGNHS